MKDQNKILAGFIVGSLVLLLGATFVVSRLEQAPAVDNTLLTQEIPVGRVQGAKDAKVILVEFSDFQCPACAAARLILEELVNKYSEQVNLSFRHFPLSQIHSNALIAAEAAEAALDQGKFWEMHDVLFKNQEEWKDLNSPIEQFTKYAGEIDLDQEKFHQALVEHQFRERVLQDLRLAESLKLNSTPTIFINDKKIQGVSSFEALEKQIQPLL